MPRKKKEEEQQDQDQDQEQEQQAEAPVTEMIGDMVAAVGSKLGDAVAAVGESAGGLVAAVADRDEGEEIADNAPVAENEESLPVTITKGADINQAKELPEYLRRRRTEVGRVVSDKMQKTVVVSVERAKPHALYKKVMRRTVKFMAHDELNSGMGDTVRIIESRPMSRRKRWQVIEIIQKAQHI